MSDPAQASHPEEASLPTDVEGFDSLAEFALAFVLAINGGSSSIKFALFETDDSLRRCLDGRFERIGLPAAMLVVKGTDPADAMPFPSMEPGCD